MEVSSSVPVSIAQMSSPNSQQASIKLEPTTAEKSPKWPKCTKTYNSKWENDPLLKTWIARHPRDNGKVVCRFCQSIIRAHKNDLLEHTRTLKHQRNFMQNSSPEEYNQFVMELNELRKEANAMSKKRSNSTTSAPTPEVKPPVYLTSVTSANSTCITTSSTTTINSNSFLNLNSNSNGVLADVLDNEELWQDGDEFMNAESPSDLVSVILEEQQSPTSTSTTVSSGSCPTSNNISLAPMTLSIHGINMNLSLGSPGLTTSNANSVVNPSHTHSSSSNVLQAESLSDIVQPSVTLQSYTIEDEERFNFTSNDVIRAVQDGIFSFRELCALAKAVTAQIEYSYIVSSTTLGNTNQNINGINGCGTAVTSNSVTISNASCLLPSTPQMTDTRANQNQNTTTVKTVTRRNTRKRKSAATAT